MPSIVELKEAAINLAAWLGKDCPPERLFWLAENVSQKPGDWGYPQSFSIRPNWTCNDLRREISGVLWGLPTHPSKVAPEYRGLPFKTLSVIADGEVARLWRDAPSSALRHEWLVATSVNRRYRGEEWRLWLDIPWAWYCRHCPISGFVPRNRAIAEWLVAKKNWAGWHRPLPIGYGPDGQMRTIRPQSLLDEVWSRDLPNGAKSNPERVFRALLARTDEHTLGLIAAANAPLPKMPWTTIHGVTQITSARDLVSEGRRMSHCVGGYVDACRNGQCYILRLPHSTAEIAPDGMVYQHRGFRNSVPPPTDQQLLARWLAERKELDE